MKSVVFYATYLASRLGMTERPYYLKNLVIQADLSLFGNILDPTQGQSGSKFVSGESVCHQSKDSFMESRVDIPLPIAAQRLVGGIAWLAIDISMLLLQNFHNTTTKKLSVYLRLVMFELSRASQTYLGVEAKGEERAMFFLDSFGMQLHHSRVT